ncbi:DUF4105 domain-containing protein [Halobacteriovorax sp. JY17]|uniref:Lnb N-terminal periplasmic domain-containing protein n=1 Tax=Halobacteriovorax sp. JY17 TaxID=2014617 RepID=UPI000C633B69|nr:DUF4105 domain-containing protein [Halobacteriovorax sp. JY17]PIK14765.1 MAG: hypothetical protein CES88_10530 [Halobacteriovorax sp. JY17]
MKKALLLILLLTSFTIKATISNQEIAHSKRWLNLLHYKPNIFSGYTSEADEPTFFFHKDGKGNPKLELEANIENFKKDKSSFKDSSERPECRFPARTIFLLETGLITNKDIGANCEKFEQFRKRVSAKSVSIIFSSYYLDTPASAFGHTFMRLNKDIRSSAEEDQNSELLDYAVNYSATVTTSNALLYAILGFAGGFKGEFAAMPYFYKVREYNDYESRDLWSYDLNLTQKEVDTIVAHIWEMGKTYFNYFYLTENCSYHMLGLLDVANEKWNLSERNPTFVLPVDTIKTITKTKGLVRRIGYRPSKMRKAKLSVSELTNEEEKLFKEVIESKSAKSLNSSSNETKAKVLDTAIDYLDYKNSKEILLEEKEAMKWKQELLVSRAETGVQNMAKVYITPENERPELGHHSRRVTLGYGDDNKRGSFQTFSHRSTLHDFYDSDIGQNPQATMEMMNFKLKYFSKDDLEGKSSKLYLDKLSLVKVISLSPIQKFFSNISWKFDLGAKSIRDNSCDNCLAPNLEVGGGAALMGSFFKTYLFMSSDLEFHKELSKEGYRFGIGPEAELIFNSERSLKFGFFGNYKWRFPAHVKKTYEYGSRLRYSISKSAAITLDHARQRGSYQSEGSFSYYY